MKFIEFHHEYGMPTLVFGKKLYISNGNTCHESWRVNVYYGNPPWKYWFNNFIFHNRSGEHPLLDYYRIWFCLFGFIFKYNIRRK